MLNDTISTLRRSGSINSENSERLKLAINEHLLKTLTGFRSVSDDRGNGRKTRPDLINMLHGGLDINQDKTNYIRKERTVSDRIKYGDADLPDELIGMTDQYSSFEDHVNIVRKDDF